MTTYIYITLAIHWVSLSVLLSSFPESQRQTQDLGATRESMVLQENKLQYG